MNEFVNQGGQQYNAPGGTQHIGIPPDQIGALIAQAVAPMAEQIRAAGLKEAAILRLARSVAEHVETFEEAIPALEQMLTVALRVQADGQHGPNLGGFVDEVLRRVGTLSAAGDHETAIRELDAALAREEEESKARMLRLLSSSIDQHLLAYDPDGAAARIARRVALETPDPDDRFDALRAEQDHWYERGRDKGLRLELEVCIALARILRDQADTPGLRGAALNDLGNALQILGQRETRTHRLEQAVAAYREALLDLTRDRVPLNWAATQNNLGLALVALGGREAGNDRLQQAVAAFEAALQVWSRDRVPLQWATARNSLGTALWILGEREAGTDRLEQAVAAYREALQEWARDRVPLDWALTQNNLGAALQSLAEREGGTARLHEAVVAFEAALQVWSRDRVPLEWAMTQNNLGNALLTLGERESGLDLLEQSVAAYQKALQEWTRDRVPLEWAKTQGNLCNVHLAFFDKAPDPAHLDAAQTALHGARDVFAQAEATQYLAQADRQQAAIDARRR